MRRKREESPRKKRPRQIQIDSIADRSFASIRVKTIFYQRARAALGRKSSAFNAIRSPRRGFSPAPLAGAPNTADSEGSKSDSGLLRIARGDLSSIEHAPPNPD